MKWTPFLWLATALVAGGCDKAPTQPDTQLTGTSLDVTQLVQRDIVPVDRTIFSGCTGEDIHIVGTIDVVFQFVATTSDVVILNGSANLVGVTGVGLTSGLTYRLGGRSILGFDGPAVHTSDGLQVFIGQTTQVLVSTGAAPNQLLKVQLRFVQTADGTVRTEFSDLTVTCL